MFYSPHLYGILDKSIILNQNVNHVNVDVEMLRHQIQHYIDML